MIKMFVEVLLNQIHINNQLQSHSKAIEGWVRNLVNPYDFDKNKAEIMGRFYNLNFEMERTAFLIRVDQLAYAQDEVHHLLERLKQISETKVAVENKLKMLTDARSLYSPIEDAFLFLTVPLNGAVKESELQLARNMIISLQKSGLTAFVGIGKKGRGVSAYRSSYFQAKQSLRLLAKLGGGDGIAHIDDMGEIGFFEHVPPDIRMELIDKHLTRNNRLSLELEETLEVFLDCDLHVKRAASRLHIHHNTLLYRLDRISGQLLLDPKKFSDAFLF
ncbi:MAG TPA: helix-turn-helix domain-containing protein [Paenibacillus sp.]|uniref:PucR family transcriptional regulator n=1 Tax=Paenibacillus sp. TaxID=58172 RepID=UPI002CD93158|nr:helix-turn-helix domain-containing protein [Paenibacillus sp.]HUC93454.1 helix-turn-helix domain-containing protein [Paenibacillus sp.]